MRILISCKDSALISESYMKPIDRILWLQDVWNGKEVAKNSCYSNAINFAKKYPSKKLKYALLKPSRIKDKSPTHMVVLDPSGTEVLYDSLQHKQSGKPTPERILYRPGHIDIELETIHVGKFEDF